MAARSVPSKPPRIPESISAARGSVAACFSCILKNIFMASLFGRLNRS